MYSGTHNSPMPDPRASTQRPPHRVTRRLPRAFAVCATAAALIALSQAGSARAATVRSTIAPTLSRHVHGHRVGGPVHSAWPAKGRAPRTPQTRWLARQVGTIKPRSCASQRRMRSRPTILRTSACSTGRGPMTRRSPRRPSPPAATSRTRSSCSTSSRLCSTPAARSRSPSTPARARTRRSFAPAPWPGSDWPRPPTTRPSTPAATWTPSSGRATTSSHCRRRAD